MQRPWGRRMLGVCEELLVNQRSGAKGMTHERKERRAEEEERTGGGKQRVGKEGGKKRGRRKIKVVAINVTFLGSLRNC